MRGIRKTEHGLADLAYVPLAYSAPKMGGFENDTIPATLCKGMALSSLVYGLLTDAPWGAAKMMSYRTHATLDLVMGLGALALTATPVASKPAVQKTFLAMGLTGVVVGALSLIGASKSN